jgi:16S rRNA (adenine1518-N6/adenine1519-N6)-dimethyltransferase
MMRAKKKYGQNFLHDAQYIHNIINAINPKKNEKILEIGPGKGALTIPLISKIDHINAIEIDSDMVEHLKNKIPVEKITIKQADILTIEDKDLIIYKKIVGNLPYYISSAILIKIAKLNNCNAELHFMLQKEVAQRVTAQPSSKAYGRLSVILQYFYAAEYLFEIPAEAFTPIPKITSALVRLTPKPKGSLSVKNIDSFEKIIKTAFQQKRKTLKNNFKGILNEDDFNNLSIAPNNRAEKISVCQFIKIENYLYEKNYPF